MSKLLARLGAYLLDHFGTEKGATYTVKWGRLNRHKWPKADIRKARMHKAWKSVEKRSDGYWYNKEV